MERQSILALRKTIEVLEKRQELCEDDLVRDKIKEASEFIESALEIIVPLEDQIWDN